ncbi:MAG: D-aminoacyl-tRNA deacylase [Dehalococcoidia bacterium]|nr:D-aminoacyl-tRNA deacylase [Dehalococcoidia bacterium]
MKVLLQRVTRAEVTVDCRVAGRIGQGFLILLGVGGNDSEKDADYLADKVVNLRVFSDDNSKFNLSALHIKAELLVISQFTLLADTSRGRRPSFTEAAPPETAEKLYDYFIRRVSETGLKIQSGIFGAHMLVSIVNDGPVTIMLDSKDKLA